MKVVRVPMAALVLGSLLAAAGCTGTRSVDDGPEAASSDAAAPGPGSAAPDSRPVKPLSDVPGRSCFSTKAAGELLVTSNMPNEPSEPITITSVELANARDVALAGAWVTGSEAGWAGTVLDEWSQREGAAWDARVQATGAQRPAGEPFTVLLHVIPARSTASGYDDVRVRYTSHGESFTASLGATARFNGPCPR